MSIALALAIAFVAGAFLTGLAFYVHGEKGPPQPPQEGYPPR